MEVFDEFPSVWEDGGESDRLGDSNKRCDLIRAFSGVRWKVDLPSTNSCVVGNLLKSRGVLCLSVSTISVVEI